ncbi:hypothetical protein HID58_022620 [Brassica napus]|uniref:Uncharacterized protein n=1 Tax=Brassica napus TaxID=3708 RepID=A0ABQ8CZS0_BRANA|nr:hypothetical protein HID58_022620 [Brassica napus]
MRNQEATERGKNNKNNMKAMLKEMTQRPRGRPSASKNKPKSPITVTHDSSSSLRVHAVMIISACETISDFSRRKQRALCIVNANDPVIATINCASHQHCLGSPVRPSTTDVTDDAVFVAFDIGMAKLTNIQAAEILVEGVYAKVDAELLRFVAEIFGKTYTFQLKIGEFNFPSKPQTFTISCIFAERHQSPLPGFVIDVEVPDAHLPGVSALASNVAADENSNFSPQPSTSADPTVEM